MQAASNYNTYWFYRVRNLIPKIISIQESRDYIIDMIEAGVLTEDEITQLRNDIDDAVLVLCGIAEDLEEAATNA